MKKIINTNSVTTEHNLKRRIIRLIKIYSFFLILVLIVSSIYGFLIHKQIITINNSSFNITSFIIGIFCFFILGIITGLTSAKNGFLDAFIASLLIILVSMILNLFIKNEFDYMTFIKGVVYVLSSSLGGVIGIRISKRNSN